MMTFYRNHIILKERQTGLTLTLDSSIVYQVNLYNFSINEWWDKQHQSDLRSWQKDIAIGMMMDIFGPMDLFLIFQKGQGYNQPHDLCLSKSQNHNVWCLSTKNDFWLIQQTDNQVVFDIAESMGSVLLSSARKDIYTVMDQLKKKFNPNNIIQTKRHHV